MGGLCTKGQKKDDEAVPAREIKAAKHPLPVKSKDARIVIVGGGPAGIHMASCLAQEGYTHVRVLEKRKEDGHFGKSHSYKLAETGSSPHEMGTCYLSWSYKHTRALLKHYLGESATIEPSGGADGPYGDLHLPAPNMNKEKGYKTVTSDEWLYAHAESVKLPESLWGITPDRLQAVGFLFDTLKYRRLHESLLGEYDYHGLPPSPSEEQLKLLNKTFAQLMIDNGLKPMLDLSAVGFGSYGFGYDVPALYGLWFVTPPAVESYIAAKVDSSVKTVELVKDGYSSLWAKMVEKDGIQVTYDVDVQAIDRRLAEAARPVSLTVSVAGGDPEEIEADLLVFAAPMKTEFLQMVKDATEFEKEMVGGLVSVGLVVSLFQTAKKPLVERCGNQEGVEEAGLTFYPESLMPEHTRVPSGEVYAERNTVRCYDWDSEKDRSDRYVVAYQYYQEPQQDAEECTRKAVEFITSEKYAVTPTPADPAPKLLYQKNWDYFPHFSQEAIQKRLPWRVLENQGQSKTLYVGSSVAFESIEDVTKYNNLVLEMNGFQPHPCAATP